MAAPQRGLGRGLGALIPTAQTPAPAKAGAQSGTQSSGDGEALLAEYAEIPVDEIVPNPRQPRTIFDEDAQAELVHSIATVGLLQPIVVRRTSDGFELVAGERRLRAGRTAGLTHIPAIIRTTDDDDLLRDALLENLHRSNLNALEEAAAYAQLLADFGCSQEELASRIGRSRPQVSNTLRLLKLPPDVQRRVAAGVLSAGHARALLSLEDSAAMDRLAQRIVAEGLSVRAVEELILLGEADGKERTKTPRQRKKAKRDPALESVVNDVTELLQHALDTRVHIDGVTSKHSHARIVIECADIEDVQRVAGVISG